MAELTKRAEEQSPQDQTLNGLAVPRPTDKVYYGERKADGSCEVWWKESRVNPAGDVGASEASRKRVPLCLEIRNHSPTGFEWGYGGSGPAQLALALLVDALGDAEFAQAHYQDFKFAVVAGWGDSWRITAEQLRTFVAARTRP